MRRNIWTKLTASVLAAVMLVSSQSFITLGDTVTPDSYEAEIQGGVLALGMRMSTLMI